MVNDEKELINRCLNVFGVTDKVESSSTFISYFDFERIPSEVKMIAKVNFENRMPLVVRVTKEDHIDNLLAERQSAFANRLRLEGINTPLKFNVNGKFVIEQEYNGHLLNFSLEEYVTPHIEKLNLGLMYEIGKTLGKMHAVSEDNKFKLNTLGYVFNFLGKNEVVRFDKLKELSLKYPIQLDLVDKIEEKYNSIISNVSNLLSTIPKFAVQGDINASNLSIKDNKLWVYDYNIACDEYLVIQFVIEGLLLTYEEEYDDNSTYDERFEFFIKGYYKERNLLPKEKLAFPLIYKVSKALWFTKIHIKDDSIEELLKMRKYSEVNKCLDDMINQLS